MANEQVAFVLPSLLNAELSDEAGKRLQMLVERIVANPERYGGSGGSESSEDSESSEGSETSEGSEDKESSEIDLLRDALATRPQAHEWGVMITAVDQLSRILDGGAPRMGASLPMQAAFDRS